MFVAPDLVEGTLRRGDDLLQRLIAPTQRASLVLHASDQGRPIYEKLGFTPTNEWVLPLD